MASLGETRGVHQEKKNIARAGGFYSHASRSE